MGTIPERRRGIGRFPFRSALLGAAAVAALAPARARADVDLWIADSGNWSDAANWSVGVPTSTADVFIIQNDSLDRTITYDYSCGPSDRRQQCNKDALSQLYLQCGFELLPQRRLVGCKHR